MSRENFEYPDIDLHAWCARIVDGGGGLRSYFEHECLGEEPDLLDAVVWTIRCLANPKCEGSAEVLEAIRVRRARKDQGA